MEENQKQNRQAPVSPQKIANTASNAYGQVGTGLRLGRMFGLGAGQAGKSLSALFVTNPEVLLLVLGTIALVVVWTIIVSASGSALTIPTSAPATPSPIPTPTP